MDYSELRNRSKVFFKIFCLHYLLFHFTSSSLSLCPLSSLLRRPRSVPLLLHPTFFLSLSSLTLCASLPSSSWPYRTSIKLHFSLFCLPLFSAAHVCFQHHHYPVFKVLCLLSFTASMLPLQLCQS